MANDKIKAKIAALLAKAEGTDNPFEAESFMAKVNELLEEHQIEMHEVRSTTGQVNDPMGHEAGETNLYASMSWARDIAGTLAKYYGCRFVYYKLGNHFKYTIIGRESARTTFELMLPFIISQVKQQGRRCWLQHGGQSESVWVREVGQALWVRVGALLPKAEERRAELSANALVPVDDTQSYLDDLFPNVKKGKEKSVSYGWEAKKAAERVSLHHQATGTRTKLLK